MILFRSGCPETGWLSNRYPARIQVGPYAYESVYHYFASLQAAGQPVRVAEWTSALELKFRDRDLRDRLLRTGDEELVDAEEEDPNRTGRLLVQLRRAMQQTFRLSVRIDRLPSTGLQTLKQLIETHPGPTAVDLDLTRPDDWVATLRLPVGVGDTTALNRQIRLSSIAGAVAGG